MHVTVELHFALQPITTGIWTD